MSGKQAVIAVLVVTMWILGGSASAQEKNNEVTGMLGRIFISDQGLLNEAPPGNYVHFGKGLSFEASYARRFWSLPSSPSREKSLQYSTLMRSSFPHMTLFLEVSSRSSSPQRPGLNLFPETAFSPWISLGGGFAYNGSVSKTLYFGGTNPGSSST